MRTLRRVRGPSWAKTEAQTLAKNKDRGTEDGLVCHPQCYAVLDGVSSGILPFAPVPMIEGLTPGQFAMKNGKLALVEAVERGIPPQNLVPFLTDALNSALAEFQREHGNVAIGKPAYTFTAYLPGHNMIVGVGDCPYSIDGVVTDTSLRVDEHKARLRKLYLEVEFAKELAKGLVYEDILKQFLAMDPTAWLMEEMFVNWQLQYSNNPDPLYGYSVLNGRHVPQSLISYVPVSPDAQRIVIASDGYPSIVLKDTLEETDAELARLLEEDPLCYRRWIAVRGLSPKITIPDDCAYLGITRQ